MSEFEQEQNQGQAEHAASRRTFLKGVGVTMALPWLESVPVWGARGDGRRPARTLPEAVRRPVHGLWRQLRPTGGPRAPATRWSWARAWSPWPP